MLHAHADTRVAPCYFSRWEPHIDLKTGSPDQNWTLNSTVASDSQYDYTRARCGPKTRLGGRFGKFTFEVFGAVNWLRHHSFLSVSSAYIGGVSARKSGKLSNLTGVKHCKNCVHAYTTNAHLAG